ncbi:MAG TPA: TIGR03435 family protein [Vicinamibacterales bacterium]|nr:TIGR03435 family protein [Vicinamibacterales bacterium]
MRGPVKPAAAGRRPATLRFVRAVLCAVFGATVLLCVVLAGDAQESQPARLTFDVVSVKRTGPDAGASIVGGGRGQYQAINVPLRVTITSAWNLRDHQIVGAPAWLASDRFDIVAKEPGGTFTDDQRRLMMQALLIDRFKLQAHVETRELPIYNLVLLRADGRLGPELKPTAVDCAALRKARAAAGATSADPPRPIPNIDERVPCNQRAFFGPQGVTINASGRTLEQIAATLGTYADRTLVNRTGLKGEYDMLLKFRPEAGGPMGGLAPPLSTTGDPVSDLATLGVAVREQLGLRLEPARGPVQVLVVDSISPPTEN